jgi:DNA-binding CsgD family transcriptional regulator/ArsR family metal-binding transcriptional regulator
MLIQKTSDLTISRMGTRNDFACSLRWGAYFKVDNDIQKIFPYINGSIKGARYHYRPSYVTFKRDDVRCTLNPQEVIAAPFTGKDHAVEFIQGLIVFLNEMYTNRHKYRPSHHVHRRPVSIVEIIKVLPRTNCRKCSYATCMAFAAALNKGEAEPKDCPGFSNPISICSVYPIMSEDGSIESTFMIETKPKSSHSEVKIPVETGNEGDATTKAVMEGNEAPDLFDRNGLRIQYDLTQREIQVLRYVADGASNPEISKILNISPHTVKSHIIHIFNKLNVNDRTQAAVWAVQNRVI